MSFFEHDFPYDEEMDPTPEDSKYTERDLTVLYLRELQNLAAADTDKWLELRFPGFQRLLLEGIETEHGLVLPAPELTEITEWDDDGYAILRDAEGNESYFTFYRPIYEAALRWQQSGNRLLTKGGEMMRAGLTVLLPLRRFEGNKDFEEFYLEQLWAAGSGFTFPPGGFISRPVFEKVVIEELERHGRNVKQYVGVGVIPDVHMPVCSTNPRRHLEQILGRYEKRWGKRGGPGFDHYIEVVVPGIVFDADRKVEERYEGWVEPDPVFYFNREAEINHAKRNANY